MIRRLTAEQLRAMTLRRQFPAVRGRSASSVVELYRRVGPVQTQVPRAAHLAVASRLPGTGRQAITEAFESYAVVKATTLRGTVHTTVAQLAVLDGVSRGPRGRSLHTLLRSSGSSGSTRRTSGRRSRRWPRGAGSRARTCWPR